MALPAARLPVAPPRKAINSPPRFAGQTAATPTDGQRLALSFLVQETRHLIAILLVVTGCPPR
jgi:hypothetical protein